MTQDQAAQLITLVQDLARSVRGLVFGLEIVVVLLAVIVGYVLVGAFSGGGKR